MLNIVVGPIKSHIDGAIPPEAHQRIVDDLKYRPDGYQHSTAFKRGWTDGWVYNFNVLEKSFRTGLLWRVCRRLDQANVQFKVVDERIATKHVGLSSQIVLENAGINPYQFQNDAAESTDQDSHCVVTSPTGTGKTVIMSLIAKRHRMQTLIIVNSRTLLDQTHEFFDQVYSGQVGIVGSGDFELGDITVATIQSLGSILRLTKKQQGKDPSWKEDPVRDWLKTIGLVIHDEVHEADSETVSQLYGQLTAAKFVGMTATPYAWAEMTEKGKNIEMEQHFGRKVYDSRGKVDFIKLGITVPLVIQRSMAPRVSKYLSYKGESLRKYYGNAPFEEYRDVVTNQVKNNYERIGQIKQLVAGMVNNKKSCYVFYNTIEYGKALCEALREFDPEMLQGSTPRAKRTDIFKAIQDKKQLLAVSDIGGYGLNIRSLDNILIASPCKDLRQLKGRVCRSFPDKTHGFVSDVVDFVPYLDQHSELRRNQCEEDGDTIVG